MFDDKTIAGNNGNIEARFLAKGTLGDLGKRFGEVTGSDHFYIPDF
jgi:hypothetical protein